MDSQLEQSIRLSDLCVDKVVASEEVRHHLQEQAETGGGQK